MERFASRRLMISHRSYPPYSQGVVDKCEKDHNFCRKVAGDFIFSGFSLHPAHIRRKIDDERKLGLPQRGYLYGKSESI